MKKTDTADRQNTAGKGITTKNPGAGLPTERIKSLV
jgi:hypothetical protein